MEWCPTGFKVGLNSRTPAVLRTDGLGAIKATAVMIGNNVAGPLAGQLDVARRAKDGKSALTLACGP